MFNFMCDNDISYLILLLLFLYVNFGDKVEIICLVEVVNDDGKSLV